MSTYVDSVSCLVYDLSVRWRFAIRLFFIQHSKKMIKAMRGGQLAIAPSYFFFQAEDGIRDYKVTGVQTCALPIWLPRQRAAPRGRRRRQHGDLLPHRRRRLRRARRARAGSGGGAGDDEQPRARQQIGRGACRERGEISVGAVSFKKKIKYTD